MESSARAATCRGSIRRVDSSYCTVSYGSAIATATDRMCSPALYAPVVRALSRRHRVPDTDAYSYPVPVYGYGAPSAPVYITPDSTTYGGITLEITPPDAQVFVDGRVRRPGRGLRRHERAAQSDRGPAPHSDTAQGYEPMTMDVNVCRGSSFRIGGPATGPLLACARFAVKTEGAESRTPCPFFCVSTGTTRFQHETKSMSSLRRSPRLSSSSAPAVNRCNARLFAERRDVRPICRGRRLHERDLWLSDASRKHVAPARCRRSSPESAAKACDCWLSRKTGAVDSVHTVPYVVNLATAARIERACR